MPTTNQDSELVSRVARARTPADTDIRRVLDVLGSKGPGMSVVEVQALIKSLTAYFTRACHSAGFSEQGTRAITTKLRDAGRRSAPWKPTSSRVPGRPQDGSDGNRILRWSLPTDHKFYADEVTATLVEAKYYLQCLSMEDSPLRDGERIFDAYTPWLIENRVVRGEYRDPVQLTVISFREFINEPRLVQSGHLHPLDRGGRHTPENTFLMLARSNQLQGNLTVRELLELMEQILRRHAEASQHGSALERLI